MDADSSVDCTVRVNPWDLQPIPQTERVPMPSHWHEKRFARTVARASLPMPLSYEQKRITNAPRLWTSRMLEAYHTLQEYLPDDLITIVMQYSKPVVRLQWQRLPVQPSPLMIVCPFTASEDRHLLLAARRSGSSVCYPCDQVTHNLPRVFTSKLPVIVDQSGNVLFVNQPDRPDAVDCLFVQLDSDFVKNNSAFLVRQLHMISGVWTQVQLPFKEQMESYFAHYFTTI